LELNAMVAPINPVSNLVAVIRNQLASRAETRPVAQPATGMRKQDGQASAPDLESLIGLRIKSIARDDPKRGRKAFRVFLEAMLLAKFGEQLINDPKFYALVDDVQIAMEADLELNSLVQAAIEHLLSATPTADA
jgi:hypothetical protein